MKKHMRLVFLAIVVFYACQLTPDAAPEEPAPTSPPAAVIDATTAPVEAPTATSAPPVPANPTLFLDEFSGAPADGWTILNEDQTRWTVTPEGWLRLQAGGPGLLDSGDGILNVNLFNRPAPDGDFILTTHLVARPGENFQQAGIFLMAEPTTYVAVLNAFCAPCLPDSGGSGIFLEGFIAGEYVTQGLIVSHPAEETSFYLRLTYSASAGTIFGEFAREPDQWQPVGSVSGLPAIEYFGVSAANAPGEEEITNDLVAFFDYLELSTSPVPVRTGSTLPTLP